MRSVRHRRVAHLIVALAVGLGLARGQAALAQAPSRGDLLRRLSSVVEGIQAASWTEESWERVGERSESSSVRCLWTRAGLLRLDVLEGRLPGTRVWLRGEEVRVSPPGPFSLLRLRFRVDAPTLRSLRGNDLRRVGFVEEVGRLLSRAETARIDVGGGEVVVAYPVGLGVSARMWLAADTLVPLRLELVDASGVVERRAWRNVALNPPVDATLFEP